MVNTGIVVTKTLAKGSVSFGYGVASLFEPGWRKTARRKKQHQAQIAVVEKGERETADQRVGTRRMLKERIKVEKVEFQARRVDIAKEEPTHNIAREMKVDQEINQRAKDMEEFLQRRDREQAEKDREKKEKADREEKERQRFVGERRNAAEKFWMDKSKEVRRGALSGPLALPHAQLTPNIVFAVP